MSDMENGIGLRRSPMEILGMDWGWVGNKCGMDQRIRHEYDMQPQWVPISFRENSVSN